MFSEKAGREYKMARLYPTIVSKLTGRSTRVCMKVLQTTWALEASNLTNNKYLLFMEKT
mgnify:CR=1 FL=1|jgi:hypothetical protein